MTGLFDAGVVAYDANEMRAALLLPILALAAGCHRSATDPNPQPTPADVALPAAGTADAVRTAKPGTAPVPGATSTATPTPIASATP